MEIKISSIGDKGNLTNERIGFVALKNCQLKYYVVFKTNKTQNGFENKSDASFWFLPQEVKENDQIVLYTKKGQNSVIENSNGTKTFFFFWGLNKPIFENENNKIVLINATTWRMNE